MSGKVLAQQLQLFIGKIYSMDLCGHPIAKRLRAFWILSHMLPHGLSVCAMCEGVRIIRL
jgi:hypothetical protein